MKSEKISEKSITKKRVKGKDLTQAEIGWVQENLVANFIDNCGICHFNLDNTLGLLDDFHSVQPPTAQVIRGEDGSIDLLATSTSTKGPK